MNTQYSDKIFIITLDGQSNDDIEKQIAKIMASKFNVFRTTIERVTFYGHNRPHLEVPIRVRKFVNIDYWHRAAYAISEIPGVSRTVVLGRENIGAGQAHIVACHKSEDSQVRWDVEQWLGMLCTRIMQAAHESVVYRRNLPSNSKGVQNGKT